MAVCGANLVAHIQPLKSKSPKKAAAFFGPGALGSSREVVCEPGCGRRIRHGSWRSALTRTTLPILVTPLGSPDPITSDHQICMPLPCRRSSRTFQARRGPRSIPDRNLRHRARAPKQTPRIALALCSIVQIVGYGRTVTEPLGALERAYDHPCGATDEWAPCDRSSRISYGSSLRAPTLFDPWSCASGPLRLRRKTTRRRHFLKPPFRDYLKSAPRCRSCQFTKRDAL